VGDSLKKIYSLIGFAQKAGKISSGTMAAKTSLLRKRARVLVMSNDISEKTRDSLVGTCDKQNIPWVILGNKTELGICVGKAYRVALTVNDENMAQAIVSALTEMGEDVKNMGVDKWSK
jgi:ribosomal protein L7Ae-like RNA K-turn-binding protein